MQVRTFSASGLLASLPLILLYGFVCIVWIAGGASREDALGQVVVRAAAWAVLVVALLIQAKPDLGDRRPVAWLLAACVALALIQLIPLPPSVWQALPGRDLFSQAASLTGQPQPWRPLALVPGGAANAAGSLVVPVAMFVLLLGLKAEQAPHLLWLMLGLICASTFIALLQFSGAGFNNPLSNDTVGEVSGTFANRNHFSLLVALGCLLAPIWAFAGERRSTWRSLTAIGLVLLFILTILASGSRVGMLIGFLALCVGFAIVRYRIRRMLSHYPRWAFPAVIGGIIVGIAALVLVSVAADRATSIERALSVSTGADMRSRGIPTLLQMIRDFFPWGSGLGGFDQMFRIYEPFDLLTLSYFNHAHNDFLEIALETGVPGLALLVCAIVWWGLASLRAWRGSTDLSAVLARAGSAILAFVLIASAFDYPARTPMIMITIVIASVWLSNRSGGGERALRDNGQHL